MSSTVTSQIKTLYSKLQMAVALHEQMLNIAIKLSAQEPVKEVAE